MPISSVLKRKDLKMLNSNAANRNDQHDPEINRWEDEGGFLMNNWTFHSARKAANYRDRTRQQPNNKGA